MRAPKLTVEDAVIEASKNFLRCRGVALRNVNFSNAAETLWSCENVELDHVTAKGDYFAMNSRDMVLRDFRLVGNIPFCLFLVLICMVPGKNKGNCSWKSFPRSIRQHTLP